MSERKRSTQKKTPMRGPMGGGPMALMPGDKAKDFGGALKKLVRYLGGYKWSVLLVWTLAVAATVLAILGPRVLGEAIDELFAGIMAKLGGTGGVDFARLGQIALSLIALYVASSGFMYLQGYVMSGVTMKITYRMRNEINAKIHRLPFGYYDKTTHGDVISRITNDVDTINQSLNQSLTQVITSITTIVGAAIMMFSISWQLTLVALVMLPLSAVTVTGVVKKSQRHFVDQQRLLGSVNGHVEEMLGSHVLVKAFSGEERSVQAFDVHNDALYGSAWKANFLSGLIFPITNVLGNISYVAICVLGGYFASIRLITVGDIQAFIQYMRSFTQQITQVANTSNVLQQTLAAAERVFEFLGEPEEVPDAESALAAADIKGYVDFDHVTFGYDPQSPVIHDFSAKVTPGQKVAIVGPTGAGKTTIVKLLMRFYDVDGGAILLDGHDIRQFGRDSLRSVFGMVLQDTWLYNGTIADNIRYGKLEATDEEVRAAAKTAQVDHFVRTLPEGYQMVLNEEASNVSQGQKQLLTIARAVLADPKILILDEATSSVDTRTEIQIQKAMDNLMRGRTSFVIAHRLSTIRDADLILVMQDGDIVEQGTHEQLLAKGGFYAELYNSQFEKAG